MSEDEWTSSLARVDLFPDERGLRLSLAVMSTDDGSATSVETSMSRRERLWLAGVLLRTLWRR